MARGRFRGQKFSHRGRTYQWFGFQGTDVSVSDAAIDSFIIVPATAGISEQSGKTLVRTVCEYATASIDISQGTDVTLSHLLQKTEIDSIGVPKGLIDPVSLDAFDLGNGDILYWGQLNLPYKTPVLTTAPTFNTGRWSSKAKRKLKTREHGVIWTVSGFGADQIRLTFIIRCLVQY